VACVAGEAESTTRTVKSQVPTWVGVPLMTPPVLPMESPGGSVPLAIENVNGAVPPDVEIVAEYGESRLPLGKVVVTILTPVGAAGETVKVNVRCT
jgi:hypothetical protein